MADGRGAPGPLDAILKLEQVGRFFGGLKAVDGVSLRLGAGERVAVLGPNGAGKTTLFHLISGELPLSTGEIWYLGEPITRRPPHWRAARGLRRTYQITNLFRGLSVLDNVRLAVQAASPARWAAWRAVGRMPEVERRCRELLEPLGLWERRQHGVAELSYGEQRQLEVALALGAPAVRVLLLDEPLAGLSPAERAAMTRFVAAIPRDITLLIIEHDVDAALGVAERVVVMHQGRILVDDTPEAVARNPFVQEVYLGAPA